MISLRAHLLRLVASVSAVVLLLGTVPLQSFAAERTVSFSGYTWTVRNDLFDYPGPNFWGPTSDSVFVDAQGRLHLKIIKRNGNWYASEVYLPRSLGYGTYKFDIAPFRTDTNTVAAPFLYRDDTHEFDIELSTWGDPTDYAGQYVVQPWDLRGNMTRFPIKLAGAVSTESIAWSPASVAFSSVQNGKTIRSWNYTGANNFTPGLERVHINFWLLEDSAPSDEKTKEFIVNRFTFTPLVVAPTPLKKGKARR